jgi:hypothetical protein
MCACVRSCVRAHVCVVAVYHTGIEDFKTPSTARLITMFLLWVKALVLNKCNTQSATSRKVAGSNTDEVDFFQLT